MQKYKLIYNEGDKIGELIFIQRVEVAKGDSPRAIFRCDCGKEFETRIESARNGRTKSCGCKTSNLLSKAGSNRTQSEETKNKLRGIFAGVGNEDRTNPLAVMSGTDIIRFISKVNFSHNTDVCWDWLGSLRRGGYGRFSYSLGGNKDVSLVATRVMYFLHYKEDPKNKVIRHTCDNPKCTNPHHLVLGTSKDNTEDMMKAGRNKVFLGSAHGRSKLTEEKVIKIRAQHNTGISRRDLADAYDVDVATISNIINRISWTHI